jgi:hypothetical protein
MTNVVVRASTMETCFMIGEKQCGVDQELQMIRIKMVRGHQ